jgi:hypothetical protein
VSIDKATPGMRLSASAALTSGYLAMASAACTLMRLGAAFCSSRAVCARRPETTMPP